MKWFYLSGFVLNAVFFVTNFVQDDTHGMIFHGFAGAFWYVCADRAAK